jgi:Ca2+-binding EF-hand superfamily protein
VTFFPFGPLLALAFLAPMALRLAIADEPASTGPSKSPDVVTPATVGSDTVDILLLAGPEMRRGRIEVRSGGTPLATVQTEALQKIARFADVDGDGRVSPAEARLLPSTQVLRQFAWGEFFPFAGRQDEFPAMDGDHDGFVTAEELLSHNRLAGLGRLALNVTVAADLARLDFALFAHLDLNGDERLTLEEIHRAEELLARLDTDHDDVLARSEILEAASPSRRDGATGPGQCGLPSFIVLRPGEAERNWVTPFLASRGVDGTSLPLDRAGFPVEIASKLDGDANGVLTVEELDSLRSLPADETWIIDLSIRNADPSRPVSSSSATDGRRNMDVAGLRLELLPREGLVEKRWPAFQSGVRDRFRELDANQDGVVSTEEARLPHRIDFPQIVAAANRDGDGQLTAKELDEWLSSRAGLAVLHARLDIIDRGRSLFDALDANGDELLSARELRTAPARLPVTESRPLPYPIATGVPHRIRATVSCGKPSPILFYPGLAAPEWFRAMDRNRDGDLSRREFTGPPAAFLRMDQNGDGLIAPDELPEGPARSSVNPPADAK